MKKEKEIIIIAVLLTVALLQGCGIVKKMAGADIDPVQFEKARTAKMLAVKMNSAESLARRLAKGDAVENADVTVILEKQLLLKLLAQYNGSQGLLDKATSYVIKDIKLNLYGGCAIDSLALDAKNTQHNVDVALSLDCILAFVQGKNDIELQLEPFNISPEVTVKGWLSSADEIIMNLIKINLADIGKNFPPLKIPLTFDNKFNVEESKTVIKDKANIEIIAPKRIVDYRIRLNEALIFEQNVFISLNLEKIEVK